MEPNEARRILEHASLCLFRSRDTAQTLDYIINDLICVNDEMSLQDVKSQLQNLTSAIKTLEKDTLCALEDVQKVSENMR